VPCILSSPAWKEKSVLEESFDHLQASQNFQTGGNISPLALPLEWMLFKQFVNVPAKVTLCKAKFSNDFVHNEVKSKEKPLAPDGTTVTHESRIIIRESSFTNEHMNHESSITVTHESRIINHNNT
jgi:hypothetical protein